MRTYDEICALEGEAELASYAGGRSRYLTWRREGDAMIGALMGHDIITATRDGVTVTTAGHNTVSTVDALGWGLARLGAFYNLSGELHYGSSRMTESMTIDYDGKVVSHGPELSPVRGADAARSGDIVDVVTSGPAGARVAETAARRLLSADERLKLVAREGRVCTFHAYTLPTR